MLHVAQAVFSSLNGWLLVRIRCNVDQNLCRKSGYARLSKNQTVSFTYKQTAMRLSAIINLSSEIFTTASSGRSDALQHPSQQRSSKSAAVSAVQSRAGSRPAVCECVEPQHIHYLRCRMNYISCRLSYPDFKRPLAPFAFPVVSSRGAARGDRRKKRV